MLAGTGRNPKASAATGGKFAAKKRDPNAASGRSILALLEHLRDVTTKYLMIEILKCSFDKHSRKF